VEIPGCILVGLLGLIVDTPIISLVALAKSPLMLLKGWRQLILDLVGQPSSCVACVPFAGLAIVLWPLVVCATVLSAIFCSPFLGLFGAVIVYQVGNHSLPITPHPSMSTNLVTHMLLVTVVTLTVEYDWRIVCCQFFQRRCKTGVSYWKLRGSCNWVRVKSFALQF
jgi:hypothetical protein